MLGFFFFFFFFLCCALPRWSFCTSPFVPSYHVARPWRSGHARAGIPFFPYVSGGEHRHSFGATSCWFSLPVRFSLRFSWRRTLALLDMLLVLRLLRRYAHNIWHITYLLSGGRWRCCCLCVFFMHDIQHTWVHVRPLVLFVVIPFARISYVAFTFTLRSLVSSGARHITYLLVGGRWRCCCLCVGCSGARTSP